MGRNANRGLAVHEGAVSQLDEIACFLAAQVGGDPKIIDTHISRVVTGRERAYQC